MEMLFSNVFVQFRGVVYCTKKKKIEEEEEEEKKDTHALTKK